jgi:hypothetical protein
VLVISLVGAAALLARRMKTASRDGQPVDSEMLLAAHLCGSVVPFIDAPGIFIWADTRILYDAAVSQARSLVGPDLWNTAYPEGQNVPLDKAVALAIQALKE